MKENYIRQVKKELALPRRQQRKRKAAVIVVAAACGVVLLGIIGTSRLWRVPDDAIGQGDAMTSIQLGTASPSGPDQSNVSSELQYISEWPENEMTEHVPRPRSGEVHYIYGDADSGSYGIVLKDISRNESNAYIDEIIEQGYTEILSESEEASAGIMLEKEDIILSISYGETELNILIIQDTVA